MVGFGLRSTKSRVYGLGRTIRFEIPTSLFGERIGREPGGIGAEPGVGFIAQGLEVLGAGRGWAAMGEEASCSEQGK